MGLRRVLFLSLLSPPTNPALWRPRREDTSVWFPLPNPFLRLGQPTHNVRQKKGIGKYLLQSIRHVYNSIVSQVVSSKAHSLAVWWDGSTCAMPFCGQRLESQWCVVWPTPLYILVGSGATFLWFWVVPRYLFGRWVLFVDVWLRDVLVQCLTGST